MNYIKEIKERKIWDSLLLRSEQGTVYLNSSYIDLYSCEMRLYGYYENDVLMAGIPIIRSAEGVNNLPFTYNQGLVFFEDAIRGANSRRIQREIELTEIIIRKLIEVEKKFRFRLHPTLTDMRPYDWFRYGEAEIARFVIKPKYTAIIDLKGKKLDQIMALARSSRRREIRYAKEREGLRLFDGASIEDLADLYKKTFAKQGVLIKDKEMDLIKKIGDYYLSECSGKIIAIENEMGYLVAGGIVFKDYDNTWHVPIVGVGDTQYGGTLLYYNIISHCIENKADSIDFDGANSPLRGYYKHSIGADKSLYFDVEIDDENY